MGRIKATISTTFFCICAMFPKPSYAVLGVGDIVFDPTQWGQAIVEFIRETAVTAKDFSYKASGYLHASEAAIARDKAALDDMRKIAHLRNQIEKLAEVKDLAGIANLLQENSITLQELDLESLSGFNWDESSIELFRDILAEMTKGEAIGIYVSEVDSLFENKYEGWGVYKDEVYDTGMFLEKYKAWSTINRDTVKGALKAIGIQANAVKDEQDLMQKLRAKTESAKGNLQVQQVSNELASVGIGQMQKLRQLIMAQMQMQASFFASEQDRNDLLEAQNQSHNMREHKDNIKPITDDGVWGASEFKLKED